jgi:hypothetical protein
MEYTRDRSFEELCSSLERTSEKDIYFDKSSKIKYPGSARTHFLFPTYATLTFHIGTFERTVGLITTVEDKNKAQKF